jgi:hypothetical protein
METENFNLLIQERKSPTTYKMQRSCSVKTQEVSTQERNLSTSDIPMLVNQQQQSFHEDIITELDAFKQSQNSSETIEQNIDVDNEAFFDEYPDWQVNRILIYAGC